MVVASSCFFARVIFEILNYFLGFNFSILLSAIIFSYFMFNIIRYGIEVYFLKDREDYKNVIDLR
jgi:hypothetical protein